MKIINEDTVIWREGIEWTEAKKIPELKNYFSIEKNFVKKSNSEKKYLSQDEEILICLNKMKNQCKQNKKSSKNKNRLQYIVFGFGV